MVAPEIDDVVTHRQSNGKENMPSVKYMPGETEGEIQICKCCGMQRPRAQVDIL
jgi:hypothetical protein